MTPLPECHKNVPNEVEDIQGIFEFNAESEDEDRSTMGYEQLSTDVEDEPLSLNIRPDLNSPSEIPCYSDIINCASSRDISFNSDKAQEIKELMNNITIPTSHFPEWSFQINEEDWKEKLLNSITNHNINLFD